MIINCATVVSGNREWLCSSQFQAFRLWGQSKEMWAEKKRGGGVGVRERERIPSSLPSPSFPPYFFLALFLRAALHYPNAWKRLLVQIIRDFRGSRSTSRQTPFIVEVYQYRRFKRNNGVFTFIAPS